MLTYTVAEFTIMGRMGIQNDSQKQRKKKPKEKFNGKKVKKKKIVGIFRLDIATKKKFNSMYA